MRLPLMLFLLAALAPVFFGKVRAAPLWLVLQALALAWIGAIHHAEWSLHTLAAVVEVVLVRACAGAPAAATRHSACAPRPTRT